MWYTNYAGIHLKSKRIACEMHSWHSLSNLIKQESHRINIYTLQTEKPKLVSPSSSVIQSYDWLTAALHPTLSNASWLTSWYFLQCTFFSYLSNNLNNSFYDIS
jgi:hypothetical protein